VQRPVAHEAVNYYAVLIAAIAIPVMAVVSGVFLRNRYRILVTSCSDLMLGAISLDLVGIGASSLFKLSTQQEAIYFPCVGFLTLAAVVVLIWSFRIERKLQERLFWERVKKERLARPTLKSLHTMELARIRVQVASSVVLACNVVVFFLAVQA
jgi:hypothetical protein